MGKALILRWLQASLGGVFTGILLWILVVKILGYEVFSPAFSDSEDIEVISLFAVAISILLASFVGLAAFSIFQRLSMSFSKQRLLLYVLTALSCTSPFLGQGIELMNRLVLAGFHVTAAAAYLTILYRGNAL